MIDRRTTLAALAGLAATAAGAQTPPPSLAGERLPVPDPVETVDLWPHGAPGMPATAPVEQVLERSTDAAYPDRAAIGIARPRLVVFRPHTPNGSAMLVAPGGGYARVVLDKEGYEIGQWLAARGWTVFVLFYRLPGDGWANRADVALADAQRAMRVIRSRATAYHIDPAKVGVMGFSAGGHVCGDLATRFAAPVYAAIDAADRLDARPAIAAGLYAVQAMSPKLAHPGSRDLLLGADASDALAAAHSPAGNVSARTPPFFLVHAEDDTTVDPENTLMMRAALKRAGVPVDTHLFAAGGHGFGLRRAAGKPVAAWPELFVAWAKAQGLG